VLIDGYPRSANTFAGDAFLVAQGYSLEAIAEHRCPLKMGNHMHAPAQFVLAKRYGVPAMLVLREPVGAALSWLVYTHEKDAASAWLHGYGGANAAKMVLQDYIEFHKALLPIKDAFVIAPFEEVTTDFGRSIKRLNDKFGTSFRSFDHTKEQEAIIFQIMKSRVDARGKGLGLDLARTYHFPDDQKAEIRRRLAAEFQAAAMTTLIKSATSIYKELLATL
jgi:hypothetical protein